MTPKTENSTTPGPLDPAQEIQSMKDLVECIIRLLDEKGIVSAEEVDEAARALEAEASEPSLPE